MGIKLSPLRDFWVPEGQIYKLERHIWPQKVKWVLPWRKLAKPIRGLDESDRVALLFNGNPSSVRLTQRFDWGLTRIQRTDMDSPSHPSALDESSQSWTVGWSWLPLTLGILSNGFMRGHGAVKWSSTHSLKMRTYESMGLRYYHFDRMRLDRGFERESFLDI